MAKSSGFQRKLQAAKTLWAKARQRAEDEPTWGEVEDGRYLVKLVEGRMGESQNGRLQIAWVYLILDGENKNETIRSYDGIESEENLVWLARKLQKLNYDVPESIDEVQAILDEITKQKPKLWIRVKTKGEYQNVYVDKLATGEETERGDADASEEQAESAEHDTPESTESEDEVTVGSKVTIELNNGTTFDGEVLEVIEAEGKLRVKVAGGKVYRVAAEKVTLTPTAPDEPEVEPEADAEEEVEEEEPPKVTKRKPSTLVKRKR